MEAQTFMEVGLESITPNPMNPRQRFEGAKFDELVESIKTKGVLEPVLLRPVGEDQFELVAGERRFRAAWRVAEENGGIAEGRIPAMVRPLTDDEAFEVMTIENLQREDLSELEEARSFKVYVDRKGNGAVEELAKKTAINKCYIRRRVKVMELPKRTLKAWGKGQLRYGHLEQLLRVRNKKRIAELTREIIDWKGAMSVGRLKEEIEDAACLLETAKFDVEKAKCLTCHQNSEIQKDELGIQAIEGEKGPACMDLLCFRKNQTDFLKANWKRSGYRKKHKTNGFRWRDSLGYDEYGSFWNQTPEECLECPDFVTLLRIDGEVMIERACVAKNDCYEKVTRKQMQAKSKSVVKGGGSEQEVDGPRVAWHGVHFREEFYKKRIPEQFATVPADDLRMARVALLAFIDSEPDLRKWFGVRHGLHQEDPDFNDDLNEDGEFNSYWWGPSLDRIADIVFSLEFSEVLREHKAATLEYVMAKDHFIARGRHRVAEHIGIDLASEYAMTEEYVDKKTIKELLALGEELGIFEDKKALTFLYETLLKKRGKFKSCKKDELKRVFLESGVDLVGKTPQEILEADERE